MRKGILMGTSYAKDDGFEIVVVNGVSGVDAY